MIQATIIISAQRIRCELIDLWVIESIISIYKYGALIQYYPFILKVITTKKGYGDMYGKIVLNFEKRFDAEKSESKDQNRGEYLA